MRPFILFPILSSSNSNTNNHLFNEEELRCYYTPIHVDIIKRLLTNNLTGYTSLLPICSIPESYYTSIRKNTISSVNGNSVDYIEFNRFNGDVLSEHLKKRELTVLEKIIIIINLAEAIEIIHEMKLIHGNVRPENIIINLDFTVKFLEIKRENRDHSNSQDKLKFEPNYSAPENFSLEKESKEENYDYHKTNHISDKVDVWSFGCIVYEIVSGFKPWSEITDNDEVIECLKSGKSFNMNKDILLIFIDLIQKCTTNDPKTRVSIKESKTILLNILFEKTKEFFIKNDLVNNFSNGLLEIFENYKKLDPKVTFYIFNQITTHLIKFVKTIECEIKLGKMDKFMRYLKERNYFSKNPEELVKFNETISKKIEIKYKINKKKDNINRINTVKITFEDISTNVYTKGVSCLKKDSDRKFKNVCLILKENDLKEKEKPRLKSPVRPSVSLPNEKKIKKKMSFKIEYVKNNFCEGNKVITREGEYNLKRYKISLIDNNKLDNNTKIEMTNALNFDIIEDGDKTYKHEFLSSSNNDNFEVLKRKEDLDKREKKKKKRRNLEEILNSLQIHNLYSFNIESETSRTLQLTSQTLEEVNINSTRARTAQELQTINNNNNNNLSLNKVMNNKYFLVAQDKTETHIEKFDYPKVLKLLNTNEDLNKDHIPVKAKYIIDTKERVNKLYFNSYAQKTPKRNKSEAARKINEFKYKKDNVQGKKIVFKSTMKGLVYNFSKYDKEKLREILNEEHKSYSKKKC